MRPTWRLLSGLSSFVSCRRAGGQGPSRPCGGWRRLLVLGLAASAYPLSGQPAEQRGVIRHAHSIFVRRSVRKSKTQPERDVQAPFALVVNWQSVRGGGAGRQVIIPESVARSHITPACARASARRRARMIRIISTARERSDQTGRESEGQVQRTPLPKAGRNFLLFAPDIQEEILPPPSTVERRAPFTQRRIRNIIAE